MLSGFALLLLSQLAFPQVPSRYGYDYVRLGAQWQDANPPVLASPVEDSPAGDADAYVRQLESVELDAGPYSDALAEPLTGLARYYRQRGQYGAAVDHYRRALHVVRLNDGLYSERQVPLVRGLLDTYRQSGDFQGLDERYEYFFRLFGSGLPPYTELRTRAALEFLRWQREAYRRDIGDRGEKRLWEMYQLNEDILESAAGSVAMQAQWYEQLVFSQIRNLYLIQTEIKPAEEPYMFKSKQLLKPAQIHPVDFQQLRMQSLLRTSVARGRELLESLALRIEPSADADQLARVYLELGDWLQWNRNYNGAREAYSRVRETLMLAGETRLLDEWLGEPVELPANGAFWQPREVGDDARSVVLSTKYDVNFRGGARNVRVTAAEPGAEVYSSRLKRRLAATRFRPRYATGDPEAVQDLSRQYELRLD